MTETDKDAALRMFDSGCNCSQVVLASCGKRFGLDEETAKGLARAFGGGVARQGGRCGALNGALMVLGMMESGTGSEKEIKERTYERVHQFQADFMKANGALDCRDLLGVDLSEPGGHDEAAQRNLFKTVCHDVVRNTILLLDETMEDE